MGILMARKLMLRRILMYRHSAHAHAAKIKSLIIEKKCVMRPVLN